MRDMNKYRRMQAEYFKRNYLESDGWIAVKMQEGMIAEGGKAETELEKTRSVYGDKDGWLLICRAAENKKDFIQWKMEAL